MRDAPYPSRYYPRLEEDILLDMSDVTDGPVLSATAAPLPSLSRETKRLLSALLALYLLVAILFALTSRAEAAPASSTSSSVEAAAGPVYTLAGGDCAHEMSLALR